MHRNRATQDRRRARRRDRSSLKSHGATTRRRPASRAGDDGKFRLRSIASKSVVYARGDGYAPSLAPEVSPDAAKDGVVTMRLVLDGGGGVVRGRVVDADNRPIGATVQIDID